MDNSFLPQIKKERKILQFLLKIIANTTLFLLEWLKFYHTNIFVLKTITNITLFLLEWLKFYHTKNKTSQNHKHVHRVRIIIIS